MHCILTLVLGAIAQGLTGTAPAASGPFTFKEISPTGLQLSDGGKPVFVYNFGMVTAKGQPESLKRSSYLHPVYAPDGTLVTDDYNPNHPHHRGIFWAWPEVTVDGKTGDLWTIKGPFQDRFVAWRARRQPPPRPALASRTAGSTAIASSSRRTLRSSPIRWSTTGDLGLHAAVRGRRPAGAGRWHLGRQKGFGGFAMRFATPDGGGGKTVIRTEQGISAKDGVLARHPWAEISGVYNGKPAGARVDDDAANPGQPNNGWLHAPRTLLS